MRAKKPTIADVLRALPPRVDGKPHLCPTCGTRLSVAARVCPYHDELLDKPHLCHCCVVCRSGCAVAL